MALSDFLDGYISVSLYSRYSLCLHSVHVVQKNVTSAQKTMLCQQKKNLKGEIRGHFNMIILK